MTKSAGARLEELKAVHGDPYAERLPRGLSQQRFQVGTLIIFALYAS